MGLDPFTVLTTGALTGLGAAAQSSAARRQNAAIDRSQQSLQQSVIAEQDQLVDFAALEKRKINLHSAQIAGRIRAATGGAISGSDLALIRQNEITLAENIGTVNTNFENQLARVRSGAQAQATQLQAGIRDPNLALFSGGLSGFQTGLNITAGLAQLSQLRQTPKPTQPDPFSPLNIL